MPEAEIHLIVLAPLNGQWIVGSATGVSSPAPTRNPGGTKKAEHDLRGRSMSLDRGSRAIPAESSADSSNGWVVRAALAAWLCSCDLRSAGDISEPHSAADTLEADTIVSIGSPLVVLTSEHTPRPWSTRCRCCPWVSNRAGSLNAALLAFAAHSCLPQQASVDPAATTTGVFLREGTSYLRPAGRPPAIPGRVPRCWTAVG